MNFFSHFLPIIIFIGTFVGTGVYFTLENHPEAFYQISPTIAVIPGILVIFLFHRTNFKKTLATFIDGVSHSDIMTMCMIFLLSGSFSQVTNAIGCDDSTVHFILRFVPPEYLLIGIFITAGAISTSIGTSMGTIATIGPIAAMLARHYAIPMDLGLATVIGGAMFGDSISPVSDTTIAAVMSQGANYRKKLILNAQVAIVAGIITIAVLYFIAEQNPTKPSFEDYNLLLVLPYLTLIILAFAGVEVFVVLLAGLSVAGIIGIAYQQYSLVRLCQDMYRGFEDSFEVFLLAMLVSGLGALMQSRGTLDYISKLITRSRELSARGAQYSIGFLVSIFDIMIPINTVAIILSGDIAKEISRKAKVPSHYTACWLDIFSCVTQGFIPYGAQVLLASSLAGVSPLVISSKVYYCFILGIVAINFIAFRKNLKE